MNLDLTATLPRKRTAVGKPLHLERVVALFTDEHTSGLRERQVDVLHRVCRHSHEGCDPGPLPTRAASFDVAGC